MQNASPINCFSCSKPLGLLPGVIGRGETCSSCGADVRVCYNCKHYDKTAYNECREPSAERVVQKDKANFCDFFTLAGAHKAGSNSKDDALKKLDDLFKK